MASEIENRAPTLHSLLKICTDARRVTRPLKRVRRRTSNEIVRVVCASIILRHRNQEMNLLQKIISVVLHRGGAAKQVSSIILIDVIIASNFVGLSAIAQTAA